MALNKAQTLSEAVQRIFAYEAAALGPARDAESARALIGRIHQHLFVQLAPVIGPAGFDAIFGRTVKGMFSTFPVLVVPTNDVTHYELHHLITALHGRSAESVLEIGAGLHTLFCIQLATFIGEALVFRLLRNEWPAALEDDTPTGKV